MILSNSKENSNRPMSILMNWMDIRHFNPKSDKMLACPCCGLLNIDFDFIVKLDYARQLAQTPFIIESGCRCPEHNIKVGGAKNSAHIATKDDPSYAVDIRCKDNRTRYIMVNALLAVGLNRICLYHNKGIIHVDDHPKLPRNVLCVF